MKISKKTILITGGGSGIGLETAKLLSSEGNKVIITGRNGDKLKKAAEGLINVTAIQNDITDAKDVDLLVAKITAEFGDLSVIINNAATLSVYTHSENANGFEKAGEEMLTNYLSVIRFNEKFLPLLKAQPEAGIVNVTSLLSFVPVAAIPSYSDSKAALHSYTMSLRHTLSKNTSIRVFELLPPLVNTGFSKEIGGETHGVPPIEVAQALIHGLKNNIDEIYVGQVNDMRKIHLSNPTEAFNMLNQ